MEPAPRPGGNRQWNGDYHEKQQHTDDRSDPEQLTKFRQRHDINSNFVGQSSHLEEAKRLAITGVGLCFLPEGFTEDEVQKGTLWPVTKTIDDLALDIYVISHSQVPEHLILKYFLNEVAKNVAKTHNNNSHTV